MLHCVAGAAVKQQHLLFVGVRLVQAGVRRCTG
jgi:hypothetical protein